MTEYSKRLGCIAPAQFQAALDRFGLGALVSTDPVPHGLFGQNVFLTSTRGEFVLRGAPHSAGQFPTERFFAEQLHGAGVPVPYPYRLEPSPHIFGWSFALMPRLPGLQLADPQVARQLTAADRLEVARALAKTLAEAHTPTWDKPGEYDPEGDWVRPFGVSYGEWLSGRIRAQIAAARGHNDHTTDGDVAWAEEVIAAARDAPPAPERPCVVLGDYGEHNVLIERSDQGWRVSGVFDLMTAHVGDGKADLNVQVYTFLQQGNPALASEFVGEYLGSRPARPGFARRQQLYALGLMASMWEYWQRSQGRVPRDETGGMPLRQWVGPLLAYWEGYG